jgi:RNA polymerase sigma-70 factor (ECF subfamily)
VEWDSGLLERLRAGDEAAFETLVAKHDGALRRVARSYVRSAAAADDVVQETWLAVIRGLDRFEGRSSLSTWIFRILINRAQTHAGRDARQIPFSALGDADGRAVDPDAFGSDGRWRSAPKRLALDPAQVVVDGELRGQLLEAIDALPVPQRIVITLRDVAGFDSGAVSEMLGISAGNQRVVLHRARARVRDALVALITPPDAVGYDKT